MTYCINCNSINVQVKSVDFARKKMEGQASAKANTLPKNRFMCRDCGNNWDSDPEAYKLYFEYAGLLPRTTIIAQVMKPSGTYVVQHLDLGELARRKELAKILFSKYKSYLDLDVGEWHNIKLDTQV